MLKAVFFDMYETLVSLYKVEPYLGWHISRDMGVPEPIFRKVWDPSEAERTVGKSTTEGIIERIMRDNGVYSKELYDKIIAKRYASQRRAFVKLNDEIIPMLEALKKRGIKLGVISNCFSEEAMIIKESALAAHFDVLCLSYDLGVCKPDARIFEKALDNISRVSGSKILPEDCLFVGDGGSRELQSSSSFGMKAVQAVWYINESLKLPIPGIENKVSKIMPEFPQVESPMEILKYLEKS